MFDENSGLVKVWFRLIKRKDSKYTKYTIDDVPDISNLRQVVGSLIK